MKNLKTLAAVAALFGATHGANAFEKDFEPVVDGAKKSDGIEMVNGQLMVKSNGSIAGVDTPYVFVGTNTTNFAKDGFAVKEMADANSVALVGNDVYFTRSSTNNVYRFSVSGRKALNGVPGTLETFESKEPVSGILAVQNGVIYAETEGGNNTVVVGANSTEPTVTIPADLTNKVCSAVSTNAIYYIDGCDIKRYDGSEDHLHWGEKAQKAQKMIAFKGGIHNVFTLCNDGTLYKGTTPVYDTNSDLYTTVSGISKAGDNLLITYTNGQGKKCVDLYDTTKQNLYEACSYTIYSATEASQTQKFQSKEVAANGLKYYVADKKIGYRN